MAHHATTGPEGQTPEESRFRIEENETPGRQGTKRRQEKAVESLFLTKAGSFSRHPPLSPLLIFLRALVSWRFTFFNVESGILTNQAANAMEKRAMKREFRPDRRGITILEIMVIVAIIALLIGLMLPALRSGGGPAARRAQCTNNLKQIALGLYNYEAMYHALPPAYTVDARGKPLHSWRTLILPFVEQTALYNHIDLARPWNDPVNSTAFSTRPSVYICPSSQTTGPKTTYLAIVGKGGYLAPHRPRLMDEITDGLSTTVAVVEAGDRSAISWMAPFDTNAAGFEMLVTKTKLHHPGGTNAALADGSVRFLKTGTPPATLKALATISGNDNEAFKTW